ncbi:MAG: DUF3868 domain-containing protein [Bacteroides sp.]|nr:DUF3868 domain-containing protein [Bacteroides sp.]
MKTILQKMIITWMALMGISYLCAQTIPAVDGAVIIHNTQFDQAATRLNLSFEAEVIEKAMNYRQSWTIIPELISADGEKSRIYPTILINGTQKERHYKRRMRYKNREMLANEPMMKVKVQQDTTQVITYSADIPYESWMDDATLTLHQVLTSAREKKQLFTTDNIARVSPEKIIVEKIKEKPVTPASQPAPSGIFAAEGSSYIQFPINQSDIQPGFMNNRSELEKIEKDIREIIVENNYTLVGIYLTGYSSPEGRYGFNESLSEARTQALKEHIVKKYGISPDKIWVNSTAEDWNHLRELITKSDLSDKSKIIAIIDAAETPDVKEKRLRALGNTWRTLLKYYFPNLRRVDYRLLYQKP